MNSYTVHLGIDLEGDWRYILNDIKANSKFEAFTIAITKYFNNKSMKDIQHVLWSCGNIFNIKNILLEYYKIDNMYIKTLLTMDSYNILVRWNMMKYYIKIYKESSRISDDESYEKLNINITPFIKRLKVCDIKFLKLVYQKKWMTMDISIYNPPVTVSKIAKYRILRKIRNTIYQHILRLV